MRSLLLLLLTACTATEDVSSNPPDEPGCVFIDAGHQTNLLVQGYELPQADVFGQMCWNEHGQLAAFEGDSLNLPIGESWSFILFFREEVYTPASLRGDVEVEDNNYNVANCEIELTLDAGRSRWLDCTINFSLADGSATLGFAETLLDATVSELSEN